MKKVLIVCLFLLPGVLLRPLFAATPAMIGKNLFSQDRKPPSPNADSTAPGRVGAGTAIGNIQLDGVIFRNSAKTAVLRLKNVSGLNQAAHPESPFVSVRVGEMVDDFRVTKIDLRSVTLERSGQSYTVGLFANNKVAAPASPPPTANAASNGKPQPLPGRAGVKPGLPNGAMFHPQNLGQAMRPPLTMPHGRPPVSLPVTRAATGTGTK